MIHQQVSISKIKYVHYLLLHNGFPTGIYTNFHSSLLLYAGRASVKVNKNNSKLVLAKCSKHKTEAGSDTCLDDASFI